MKTIKNILLVCILVCSTMVLAQNNGDGMPAKNGNLATNKSVKPLRLGVKSGVPNALSLHLEYVTPLLDNRVAASFDYNPFSFTAETLDIQFNIIEIGTNIYLNNKGSGLYAGVSYTSFEGDVFNPDVEFDDGTFGPGTANVSFNTINTKVGVKLGRVFYFRLEIGYGFGSLPNQFITESIETSSNQVEFIEDIEFLEDSGIPQLNLGIGFGFL